MEPLKKIQVDGYAMFAEPELLFGNLDELCCVSTFLIRIDKYMLRQCFILNKIITKSNKIDGGSTCKSST